MPTVLIADDEPAIRRTLREILEFEGYGVEEAADGDEALDKAREGVDLVLLDIKMPKRDGMEVLQALHDAESTVPVVMISGHGTVETAVEATQLGAVDFLEKPPDLNRLLVTVRGALDRGQLQVENTRLKQVVRDQSGASDLTPIVGDSPAIARIQQTVARVAPSEARVLITGEPGTGKELVARHLHAQSSRADGPLVEVNCAAIPSELIESELFGHEKGAFTGATKQRIGKFEQADGGTLFLDEIGDMSLDAQAKVLRALQESRITRVGGDRSIPVDVRVVAATNRDLLQRVDENRFREDLYHRISVILVHVPPLRERRGDIPGIAEFILGQVMRRNGMEGKSFSDDALDALRRQEWRGNVRELRNVVERLLILSDGDQISAEDVDRYVVPGGASGAPVGLIDRYDTLFEFRDQAEKLFIERKLDENDWNVSHTAELIGIQRSHLYNKLKDLGIERPE
ncbi:sigma-54-dependent transcriptional regulator [Rubrivirga marina]|uniref:Fis family transcriptional regulator n=1 Tax=Rubrivirga marina TaxID=1196024 RepID=A0A271J147_9BACT|nr:sigma-54 dependent transcriptional regulator [Rubrivirga marina]PAP77183.1 Fis family transcriptional regulator [Rubrivirga marina]